MSDKNNKIMYIPEGFAHGYLVLSNNAIFQYKCTEFYHPEDEFGLLWNDKDLNIDWPSKNPILSQKDKDLPTIQTIGDKYFRILPDFIRDFHGAFCSSVLDTLFVLPGMF